MNARFMATAVAVAMVVLSPRAQTTVPFVVGEHTVYDASYRFIHVGSGSLDVMSIDTVRGHDAYRFRLTLNAGVNLLVYKYSIRDTMQSWVDTGTFRSLRFEQDQHDGGKRRVKRFEIFPERATFSDSGKAEMPSVSDPLDDISFLFFARTLTLKVGETQTFPRHFRPESNPVVLRVIRKDTVEIDEKHWITTVVQPIIKGSSTFSEKDKAEVWIADDSTHAIVQIRLSFSFGPVTLKLKSYRAAGSPARSGF